MQTQESFTSTANHKEWTAEKISEANSSYYPFSSSGPLCPILNDENLLLTFYPPGNNRKEIKRLLKTKVWPNKPKMPLSISMSDDALKKLLKSMWNSPEARQLIKKHNKLELHNAIWEWFQTTNPETLNLLKTYCHKNKNKNKPNNLFITPEHLGNFFNELNKTELSSIRNSLIYITLAFGMLENKLCSEYFYKILKIYPDASHEIGIENKPTNLPQKNRESNSEDNQSTETLEIIKIDSEKFQIIPKYVVECRLLHINDLTRKTEELKKSFKNFTKNIAQLTESQESISFINSENAATLLTALESDRKNISNQIENIKLLTSKSCRETNKHECQLQDFFKEIQDNPATTVKSLTNYISTIQTKANTIITNAKSAKLEFKQLISTEIDLNALLDLPNKNTNYLDGNYHPCKILQLTTEQRIYVTTLRQKIAEENQKLKNIFIANCLELEAKYKITHNESHKNILADISELKSLISLSENIKELKLLEINLKNITNRCIELENFNTNKLATQLKENINKFPAFLDICRSLINQKTPEISFLLLHLRQNLYSFKEISGFSNEAISILLETSSKAALGELELSTIWHTLSTEPWLLSISRDDIDSPEILENIIITTLGNALGENSEKAAMMLLNISAAEFSRQTLPKIINEFLQALITRQKINLVSSKGLAIKHEQENHINEIIAFENGKYRHLQCSNATHFARFESVQVFPAMQKLWEEIHKEIRLGNYQKANKLINDIDIGDWYLDLNRKYDRPVGTHPHFPVKIRDFMRSFLTSIQNLIGYCEELLPSDHFTLAEDQIKLGLENWAGTHKERKILADLVIKNLTLPKNETFYKKPIFDALATCKPIILKCPNFIIWLRKQQNPEIEPKIEKIILDDLEQDFNIERCSEILHANQAWKQLSILHQGINTPYEQECITNHERDIAELVAKREDMFATKNQKQIENFNACIESSRVPAAHQIFNNFLLQKEELREYIKLGIKSFASAQIEELNKIKDNAADLNMPEDWQNNISKFSAIIERQLRVLQRTEDTENSIQDKQAKIISAINSLKFIAQQQTKAFDEVEYHLRIFNTDNTIKLISTTDSSKAIEKCPELIKHWNALTSTDLDNVEIKKVWGQFVKEFSRTCNLYHDEQDEKKRFITIPSIKYPFLVYQTAFHKPQSEFMKRPLRLYLYRQRDIDTPALQRLETELSSEDSAAWLHILFAPQGLDKVRRFFNYDKGFKNFLLIDNLFLNQICIVEKHDVPVRQSLHASVTDLVNSSPFVAQGYCHQKNNIYVGRKDTLQKLLNTPQAMIWGGRRIGKTSVLHTLENTLKKRNYNVAYVYVDIEDNGDPDLSIAKKIAAKLKLSDIASITDFEREITEKRNSGLRFAFLIDEVDEYIKKSRLIHGQAFPLATVLRQLVMDDSSKETVLVYSGYHQLYYEAKLDTSKRRVGHPFINIAQHIPIRDLTHDDVNELLKTGFQEMLGITVNPDVPALISQRASRHPAFVQQFSRSLLEWVSKRRSPGTRITITRDDVEAVYAADGAGEGEEQPFIFYFHETLGYNLSNLGRAIMLMICDSMHIEGQAENDNYYYSIQKIESELNHWFDIVGVAPPEPEHFQQTIELLVMTNMLTQNPKEHNNYRVTYLTYIDILRRLDKLGKAAIGKSIHEYNQKERTEGVLL